MKAIPILVLVSALAAIFTVSGCTQLQEQIPNDDTVSITNIPHEETDFGVEDCERYLKAKEPDAKQFKCYITKVDINGGVYDCECIVHRGLI